jgi:hypothetical protein
MDDVFAGDVDYPVIMRIGKWHDGRLTEQTEMPYTKNCGGLSASPNKVYGSITAEEAGEFKLRHGDEGYYTRSTKTQAAVKAYIELPGKALDIFPCRAAGVDGYLTPATKSTNSAFGSTLWAL